MCKFQLAVNLAMLMFMTVYIMTVIEDEVEQQVICLLGGRYLGIIIAPVQQQLNSKSVAYSPLRLRYALFMGLTLKKLRLTFHR